MTVDCIIKWLQDLFLPVEDRKSPGLRQLEVFILDGPARIGYPLILNGMTKSMQNPKYSTVLGLLIEANKRRERIIEKSIIMGSSRQFYRETKGFFKTSIKRNFLNF